MTSEYDITASDLYQELEEAIRLRPDYRKVYRAMNGAFLKCLDQTALLEGVRFSGPFAKTDYLLKECHASRALQKRVNDARVRLRKQKQLTPEELADNCLYDFQSLCEFVSLVLQVPIPAVMEARFPDKRTGSRKRITAECLRVIVNKWDDTCIHANADAEGTGEVTVFYGGTSEHATYASWDWSYLQPLLRKGCQLNLIRPREYEGIYYPELIIYEPDYLVDISAIASCFESYGHTPLTHLLNKIKPSPSTPAILLGHLASQFLDEGLQDEERTYAQSIQTFFKEYTLGLLTAELPSDFHAKAREQQQNIGNILKNVLPQLLAGDNIRFDSANILVEPSFFSEMLGIQGRMDFLELQQKVLIEQKSGKGGFPQPEPETPVHQEKHYVQLLLYMLLIRYNYREQYERNNHELHAFLLYSKYRNGLLGESFSPQLVFEAIRLRNELTACEFNYSRNGLKDVLGQLTAESLRTVKGTNKLWEQYQKPQIEALLAPIHAATPLEQAYYFRFMTFLETEHLLAKVGHQTKEHSGFADKWHSTLDEKLTAGNIYDGLELLIPSATDDGNTDHVVLKLKEDANHYTTNFRTGDIVILYPYDEGEEPDARRSMVFRCTIEDITTQQLTLHLRATQPNAHAFWYQGERKWAVEHDFFESSFNALYRGMHAFLSAPKERKDLLLLQREAAYDETVTLSGNYDGFNELSLRVRQAQDLFLIIGPPGTGKTSYGLVNTLKEELLQPDASVLLLAYTNRAVDEICSKLLENQIDFIRIGGRFTCDEACRPHLLESMIGHCSNLSELRETVAATRVFVGTTTAYNSNLQLFGIKQFSLAIIDEASQILEPHLIGLLSACDPDGHAAIRKFVLIGDHKQLPAVVAQAPTESKATDEALHAIHLTDCRHSLFERLLRHYSGNPHVVYMLTRQGRMHHDIADFPNKAFYQGLLEAVPLAHQLQPLPAVPDSCDHTELLLNTTRAAFVAVPAPDHSPSDKVNPREAKAIAQTVFTIYRLHSSDFSPSQTVGVIVPYRNQIAEIRQAISAYDVPQLRDITIDTVERYQGSQRDYIIYGFTVQKAYQLRFLTDSVFTEDGCVIDRRLNVVMTRARLHLVMFGNPDLLARNAVFSRLMAYMREQHTFFQLSEDSEFHA